MPQHPGPLSIPWFGARKFAGQLQTQLAALQHDHATLRAQYNAVHDERDTLRTHVERLGLLSVVELEAKRDELSRGIADQIARFERDRVAGQANVEALEKRLAELKKSIVETEDLALLQEAGVYHYRHPLSDAVAYERALEQLESQIKEMTRKDGGAVLATTNWTVNNSVAQGRAMVNEVSKLMLRAFNAEADNLVRGLKPYKLDAAVERLSKVAETIARLGKTMQIRISPAYVQVRIRELELTADFLQKQAEEKEIERAERERLKEERKAQQEMERERERLAKEKQHYLNALEALRANGDDAGAGRMEEQLQDVDKAIADVDYRSANIKAGYVYVISNIGSFGEHVVKVGMTRRLDPTERIRELSDASVPFNFDVHALFFSKDAVGIETAMHHRLEERRLNTVNRRREFFQAAPLEVKALLAELAGELLEFQDVPEALEFRQSVAKRRVATPLQPQLTPV